MPRVKGRSGRAARIQNQKAVQTRLAPVTRRLMPLEVLDADAIERIHDASLSILEEVGIDFRDPVALDHWRQAGADVSGDRVRIDFFGLETAIRYGLHECPPCGLSSCSHSST